MYSILTPLLLTLVSEVPLAMLLFKKKDIPFAFFASILNIITNLSLNFALTNLPSSYSYFWSVFTGEVIVYLLEYLAYALWTKRWIYSFFVSVLVNSVSLLLGLGMNATIEKGADIQIYALVFLGILVIELGCFFVFSFLKSKQEE
jgi:hypothetical protein